MKVRAMVLENEIAIIPSIRLVMPFCEEVKSGYWIYIQFLQWCVIFNTESSLPASEQ